VLTQLRSIVEEVTSAPSFQEALDSLVTHTRRVMHTDCCSVYLADEYNQHFVLMATEGLAADAAGLTRLSYSEGVVGLVGQREEPINLADVQSHPHFKYLPEVKEEEFRSFLGTPIIHQRRVLGVLVVQQKDQRQFNESEESFLVTLAAQLATVIAHAEACGILNRQDLAHNTRFIQAVPGSPGIAIGKGYLCLPSVSLEEIRIEKHRDLERELAFMKRVFSDTLEELTGLAMRFKEQLPKETLAIFDLYRHMLAKASLGGEIEAEIRTGLALNSSIKVVSERYMKQFAGMSDPYLRERVSDLRDLAMRLLHHASRLHIEPRHVEGDVILVAEEVTASMLGELPRDQLKGVVSVKGSVNSHAAILARAMGLPALMGVNLPLERLKDTQLILDGYKGQMLLTPEPSVLEEYRLLLREEQELYELTQSEAGLDAVTQDRVKVRLLINSGLSVESDVSINSSADGVGLFRTEVPFMLHHSFPSEDEQYLHYRSILRTYQGRPVCMRTLDVGGDKQLPYFPIIEENPFLGWRGLRLTLDHPELFLIQIKAMLRANIGINNLSIMLPMVTSLNEVDEAKRLFEQAWLEVSEQYALQGEMHKPSLGVMIEVPASLFMLPELAKRVDFCSIGTNDLTQYLLAVDRNNPRVAGLYDTFHPAVVRALYDLYRSASRCQLPVSVCGELAGDPVGAVMLLAMGYRRLSMNTFNLGKIKYIVRRIPVAAATELLQKALALESGREILRLFISFFEDHGLGGFVRAGK